MAVRVEAFLALEQSLSTRITNAWIKDVATTQREIIDAVDAGDFVTAADLCDQLAIGPSAERSRDFANFIGMQAVLFGASRLTQGDPRQTRFMRQTRPEEVERATDALINGLAEDTSQALCRHAHELVDQERAAQQDATYKSERRKDVTANFIRGFSSSIGSDGKVGIDIGSSLHNSRLGAWGFTQEAEFRGVKKYQVSEVLDGRTCPVCEAMHGRTFDVGPAASKLSLLLDQTDPKELKALAPFPKQNRAAVTSLRQMPNSRLQNNGWDTPPYHPLCRGLLVEAGSIPNKLPDERTPGLPDEIGGLSEDELAEALQDLQANQGFVDAVDELASQSDPHLQPFTGSVAEYRDRFFKANVTKEDVLARHDPSAARIIAQYEKDIKAGDTTWDLHRRGDDWTAARKLKHKEIIEGIFNPEDVARATAPAGQQPSVTFLGGRGGSGKTFLTEGIDEDYFKANKVGKGAPVDISDKIVLNSDEIKKLLPEYEGWNAGLLHQEGSWLLKEIEMIARERRINVVLDTTLAGKEKALANLNRFIDAGYRAEGYYMHLPREEAAFRAVFRGIGGEKRYVPVDIILDNLDNEDAFDAMKAFFTRWGVWDNQVDLGDLPRFVGGHRLPDTVPRNKPAGGGPSIAGREVVEEVVEPVAVAPPTVFDAHPDIDRTWQSKPRQASDVDGIFEFMDALIGGSAAKFKRSSTEQISRNYKRSGASIEGHSGLSVDDAKSLLTAEEKVAMHKYTDTTYRKLNSQLGGWSQNSPTTAEWMRGYARVLDDAMSKLPSQQVTSYRGMTLSGDAFTANVNLHQVGRTINYNYFMSSATSKQSSFSGNFHLVINGKTGKSTTPYSQFGYNETEILFRPGAQFRVVRVDENGPNGHTVYLDEVTTAFKAESVAITPELEAWILEQRRIVVEEERKFMESGMTDPMDWWNPSPVWWDKMKITEAD